MRMMKIKGCWECPMNQKSSVFSGMGECILNGESLKIGVDSTYEAYRRAISHKHIFSFMHNPPPDWCPLRQGSLEIKLENERQR